jgi:oligoribonuclease
MSQHPTRMIWIDLETTGLDPERDRILEVAVILTTLDRPFEIDHTYSPIVRLSQFFDTAALHPVVQHMHTANKLFKECTLSPTAKDLERIELELLDIIPPIGKYEELPVLAGSTVHFDHAFNRRWMPRVNERLSHRHYDVSAIKLFCRSLGMPKLPKSETHRAYADIVESRVHAEACIAWLAEHFQEPVAAMAGNLVLPG